MFLLGSTVLLLSNGTKPCCIKSKSTSRCTGSRYCSACRNCSRCAYCGSGGYCGVCRPDLFEESPKKHELTTATFEPSNDQPVNQQLDSTLTGQSHSVKKHKTKSHSTKKPKATVEPVTRITMPVAKQSDSSTSDEKSSRGLITCGIIVMIIAAIYGINSIAKKRRAIRREEEAIQAEIDAKKNLKKLISDALQKNEISQDQYEDLMKVYSSSTSTAISRQFEVAKKFKMRVDYLLSKYNEDEVLKILKHQYWIGMTEEQLIDCKGEPTKIETEQLKTKTKRIFIYGNKSSGDVFNFVDGVLERFKDR